VIRRVEAAPVFERDLKRLARRYRHIRQDLEPLIEQLENGQTPGDQISGLDYPVYKVRLKNTDARRGKSGGYRVIYYWALYDRTVLLAIYSKSDQGDISDQEILTILNEHNGHNG
jgi:mRNA-degrading endonuclease RelE of RelBE toxin-antitoxin system